ncbi:MAG TPA: hypothetical protein VK639_22680 [Terriglobales bacterium]|nr:hypothetical protein [Terriglobales bacterium]
MTPAANSGVRRELLSRTAEQYRDDAFAKERLVNGLNRLANEAGAEKCRYVTGWALAVNSKGETRRVSLQDIYDLAGQIGEHVTKAEYEEFCPGGTMT